MEKCDIGAHCITYLKMLYNAIIFQMHGYFFVILTGSGYMSPLGTQFKKKKTNIHNPVHSSLAITLLYLLRTEMASTANPSNTEARSLLISWAVIYFMYILLF